MRIFCLQVFYALALCCLSQIVRAQCEVDAGQDIEICAGETVQLGGSPTVVSGDNPVINWNNGLGNDANPMVTPLATTTYTVNLSADAGCNTNDQVTVMVNQPPIADFTFNPNGSCAGENVVFVDQSIGSNLEYSWDFGNPLSPNNSSTNANSSHQFVTYGNGTSNFTVTLTVTDNNGCTDTYTETVMVTQSPDPLITDSDIFSPFVSCGPPGTIFEIEINNGSITQATNTNYTIDWGDDSGVHSCADFSTLSHIYANSGFFDITVTVDGENGCSTQAVYEVFFGNNPSVALGGGNTIGLCAPTESLSFPILNTDNNPPGTIYTVSYNDGSPDEIFTHPPPVAVEHVFNGSSCGTTSLGGFANSFHVRIIAENPCGQSSSTFEPVQTSSPPIPGMDVLPGNEWCSNTPSFQFVNTSTDAFFNNNGTCSSLMVANWSIEPATGWLITAGALNSADGFSASFDPGTYTVTMEAGNPCGSDVVSTDICATPPPAALFNIDDNNGCAPHVVSTENLSNSLQLCDQENYLWEVFPNSGYSFSDGGNTSIDPEVTFTQEGTYTLQLTVTNLCGSDVYTQSITVTEPPAVSVSEILNFCEGVSINPNAIIDNGGGTISDYLWTTTGGSPASSNAATPGSITYDADGSYTVTLAVTNDCGTATDSESFTVESAPDISIVSNIVNSSICAGNDIQLTASGAINYNWNFDPSLNTTSGNTVMAAPSASTVYTVNGTSPAGCPGSQTIEVDVFPLPIPSISGDGEICVGSCTDLSTAVLDGTPPYVSYSWSPALGLSNTNLSDPTACPIVDTDYSVSVTDQNGCIGSDEIFIDVNLLPVVNTNGPLLLCNQPVAEEITGVTPVASVGETGVWSGLGVTGDGFYTPTGLGLFTVNYTFTDINGCVDSEDLTIEVVDPSSSDGGADVELCESDEVSQLVANSPSGVWSSVEYAINTDGSFIPDAPGIYNVTFSTGAGSCLSEDQVVLEIYDLPIVEAGTELNICEGDSVQMDGSAIGGELPYTSYNWSPAFGITDVTDPNTFVSPASTTNYILEVIDSNMCSGEDNVNINVLGSPMVEAGADLILCNQPIPEVLTGYSPLPALGETGLWSGDNVTPDGIYTPSGVVNNTLYYTYTNVTGCSSLDSILVSVVDPIQADAGDDIELCLNAPIEQLLQPGTWTGTNVSSDGMFTPSLDGVFDLSYTIGTGTCETSDDFQVTVWTLPSADAGVDLTICENDSVQLGLLASGDHLPIAAYSWSGGNGLSSSNIADPWASPTSTQAYSVTVVDSNGCSDNDQITVNVNPAPSVEAGDPITVCNQAIAEVLTGFSPLDPLNGVWSGNGISNPEGEFTSPGLGTYMLTYTFTGGVGCEASDSVEVTVIDPVIAQAGLDQVLCLNNGGITLDGFSPIADITWSGAGITDPLFGEINIEDAGVGLHYLVIEFGEGTCFSSDSLLLEVIDLPLIDPGTDEVFCGNLLPQQLSAFDPLGGTWEGIGIVDAVTGEFDPSVGEGLYDLFFWFTDPMTGCSDTAFKQVEVSSVPQALFDLAVLGCTNASVDMSNNSVGASSYEWNWGNADDAFGFEPNYTYPDEGFFDVSLIAINLEGCQDTLTQTNEIIDPPLADLVLTPDEGCAPLEVSFENTSIGQYLTYLWDLAIDTSVDFEPGDIIYQQEDDIALYEISLEASNFCGSDLALDTVRVFPQPVAGFGTDLDEFCSPWTVNMNNTSLGNPDTYEWDFDDGTFSNQAEPLTHIYYTGDEPTDYTIQLITENECGVDTFDYTITVLPNTVTAFFNTDVIEGCSPLDVEFTDFSDGSDVISYDFGDDNFTNNPNPTHLFTDEGFYTVTQMVNNGCSFDTTQIVIEVFPSPDPAFSTDLPNVCVGQPIQFFNETIDVNNVNWAFGDGEVSNITNPLHIFENGGTFPVTIDVTSDFNECIATLTQDVTVYSAPESDFAIDSQVGCAPFEVAFNNTTVGGLFNQWDFGDQETASVANPTHVFLNNTADPISYDVMLISQNIQLCADTIISNVVVSPSPVANFELNITESCSDLIEVIIDNQSIYADNYAWDFGSFGASDNFEPGLTVTGVGQYEIELNASNAYGCSDELTQTLTIHPLPAVEFSTSEPNGCIDHQVDFFNETIGGLNYSWDFGDDSFSSGDNPSHIYSEPGSYNVSLIAFSDQGCTDTLEVQQLINAYPLPVASFEVSPTLTSIYNSEVRVLDQSSGADFWSYSFGDGQISLFPSPSHTYETPGNYIIDLTVSTVNGCEDAAFKSVTIGEEFNFYVPNTFTPDGDNINEYFQPVILGEQMLEFYEFKIFDRWGIEVFVTDEPSEGWLGDFQGAMDTYVPDDVYTWQARIRIVGEDESRFYYGHVSILR